MIDTTDINERLLSDVLWDMVNEINRLDNELLRVKAEMKALIERL